MSCKSRTTPPPRRLKNSKASRKKQSFRIASAGSITEAAIGINSVFEAAQAAAD